MKMRHKSHRTKFGLIIAKYYELLIGYYYLYENDSAIFVHRFLSSFIIMDIEIVQSETKGAAYYSSSGKRLAEMSYSVAGTQLITIDHTEVDQSLKGKGVEKRLLTAIVDKARLEGIKILPLYPFAKSIFDKDESFRDVLR